MSNQTQATTNAAPQTIHIWMFATAVLLTILAIPHAIVVFMLDMSPAIVNLHMIIALGCWIGAVVFATQRTATQAAAPAAEDENPLTPKQRKELTEVDRIEEWLHHNDERDR